MHPLLLLANIKPVIVEEIGELVHTVRHGTNGGTHRRIAHIEDARAGLHHTLGAIARGQSMEYSGAYFQAG